MRKSARSILLLLLALSLLLYAFAGLADAGNFSGDSDWGGSDWGGSDWDSDWGSDWGSSSYSGGYSSGDSSSGGSLLPIIVLIIIVVLISSRKKKKGNTDSRSAAPAPTPQGMPLAALREKDPNFNEQALLEQIGNMYIQMQDAWQSKDWEPMRAFMTDSLFNQMGRQLEELKSRGLTNCVDRIAVLDSFISRYYQQNGEDVLVVRLSTRICDYTVKDATGELVRGSRTKELFMTYDWTLTRGADVKTLDKAQMTKVNCPNCGAPLSIKESGRCDYCGTVVTLTEHDWVLSSIKGISQRSNG